MAISGTATLGIKAAVEQLATVILIDIDRVGVTGPPVAKLYSTAAVLNIPIYIF